MDCFGRRLVQQIRPRVWSRGVWRSSWLWPLRKLWTNSELPLPTHDKKNGRLMTRSHYKRWFFGLNCNHFKPPIQGFQFRGIFFIEMEVWNAISVISKTFESSTKPLKIYDSAQLWHIPSFNARMIVQETILRMISFLPLLFTKTYVVSFGQYLSSE